MLTQGPGAAWREVAAPRRVQHRLWSVSDSLFLEPAPIPEKWTPDSDKAWPRVKRVELRHYE